MDLESDPAHCGACGVACDTAQGQVCSQGTCALACGGGTTECGSSCFDLNVDPSHCGACGTSCAGGESCTGGKCGVACATGLSLCGVDGGGVCVDLQTDDQNCGACGAACGPNQSCAAGTCAATLVKSGPTDVNGPLPSCTTDIAQVTHRAAMTDGHDLAVGMICGTTGYVVTSKNGGLSWSAPVSTGLDVGQLALAASYGPKPVLYAAGVSQAGDLAFTSSADGGATWGAPVTIDSGLEVLNGVRIDSYGDTVYLSAKTQSGNVFHVLRNGAGAGDAGLADAGDAGFALTTLPLGYAEGNVMVDQANGDVWFAADIGNFQFLRSTNGGATFGAPLAPPGVLIFSDWVLAGGTIYGTGLTDFALGTGALYAMPVASVDQPKFVGGLGYTVAAQQWSLAASPSGTAYAASVETTGVQIARITLGSGESVNDAGVVSDAALDGATDGGVPGVSFVLVSNATGAKGPQVATRVDDAVVYAYTLGGRVYAGVETF